MVSINAVNFNGMPKISQAQLKRETKTNSDTQNNNTTALSNADYS